MGNEKSAFDIDFQNGDTSSKIVAGLERISEAYKVMRWDLAKEIGLSPIQIQMVNFIRYHTPDLCSVSALAKELNLTKPTTSDAVKVLIKKGFVEREPSTIDKRAHTLVLTSTGIKISEKTEKYAQPFQDLLNGIDGHHRQMFYGVLNELIFKLYKADILSVQRTCKACRFFEVRDVQNFCHLLDQKLDEPDLRIDCPEFEMA